MITFSIMLATTMQTLDSTIANVALPHMQGAPSAFQDQIAWVLTAYIVAAAIATPLTGWLVDRFGRKIMLIRPPERSKIGDMDAHAVVD
jgi:DHA2 family multidrug resistance protein